MEIKKYYFIINPNSGTSNKKEIINSIPIVFKNMAHEILYTQYTKHAKEIASQLKEKKDIAIVAIGGDGTVNEISSEIIHSDIKLGIIPCGSGNGFARHLQIPIDSINAIHHLINGNQKKVDVIRYGKYISCNTSGFGFTAYVAKIFGTDGKRGFWAYLKLGLSGFTNYPAFTVIFQHQKYENILALEIANSSQVGNNAYISPVSSVQDGIAEIVMLKKPKWYQVPLLLFRIFNKTFPKSDLSIIISAASGDLIFDRTIHHHIDGEFIQELHTVNFAVEPNSLSVIA